MRVVPPTSNGGAEGAFIPELRAINASDPRLSQQALETGNAPLDRERLLPAEQRVSQAECYLCGPPRLVAASTAQRVKFKVRSHVKGAGHAIRKAEERGDSGDVPDVVVG